jgi:hypothetical protein
MIKVGDHRGMILSPMDWPLFHLPLKRPRKGNAMGFQCAVLLTAIEDENAELVIATNFTVYGLPVDGERKDVKYSNVDALLADGWIVD